MSQYPHADDAPHESGHGDSQQPPPGQTSSQPTYQPQPASQPWGQPAGDGSGQPAQQAFGQQQPQQGAWTPSGPQAQQSPGFGEQQPFSQQQGVSQQPSSQQPVMPQQQVFGAQQGVPQQPFGQQQGVPQQQPFGQQPGMEQQQVFGAQQGVPQQPFSQQQAVPQQPFGQQQTVPQQQYTQPQGQGSDTVKVVIAVVAGLVLLVLIVFGAWKIFSGGDSAADGSAGGSGDQTQTAVGCTNDVCIQTEATVGSTHTGDDQVEWALEGTWADFVSGDPRQLGGGTAVYSSEVGEVSLTAVGFESPDHAAAYADRLMADLGEPFFTGPVWDGHYEGRGEGVLNQFDVDGMETIVWYDDAGIVCTLVGPYIDAQNDPIFNFYFTLPAI